GESVAEKTPEGGGDVAPEPVKVGDPNRPLEEEQAALREILENHKPVQIDYSKYANTDVLGDGAAKQQLRKLLDDLQVAEQQQALGKAKLEGTQRLFDKGFVTKSELETEEMTYRNTELKVQT